MLNKLVCNHCWETRKDKIKAIHFQKQMQSGEYTWWCCMADNGWIKIEIVARSEDPPQGCPYVLEHLVNEK